MYVDCEEDSEDMRERGMKGLGHRDACATQNCISYIALKKLEFRLPFNPLQCDEWQTKLVRVVNSITFYNHNITIVFLFKQ